MINLMNLSHNRDIIIIVTANIMQNPTQHNITIYASMEDVDYHEDD